MLVHTVGHGTRPIEELVAVLTAAEVRTVVDVRRFPGSRRHPQFGQAALDAALAAAGITYRHAPELGGRRANEPGEERFACIRVAAFRSYAARMTSPEWQVELASELCRGRTVVDLWRRTERPPNVQVGVSVDAEAFFELLVQRIASLG